MREWCKHKYTEYPCFNHKYDIHLFVINDMNVLEVSFFFHKHDRINVFQTLVKLDLEL